MIIRSQDKKRLVKINTLSIEGIRKRKGASAERKIVGYGIYNYDHYEFKLGEYSTEEKAIKVLDMIQSAYNAIETMKIDKGAWRDNHYFQMPSDESVEVQNE